MEKFKTFRPSSTESAFGYGDDVSNYGSIIPVNLFREVRNAIMLDLHTRRSMQDRPFYTFNGAAEHLLLTPLSGAMSGKVPSIDFFFEMARNTAALSRAFSLSKSKVGVGTLATLLTTILPNLTTPGEFNRQDPKTSGFETFSQFIFGILSNPSSRDTVFKTLSKGSFEIAPLPNEKNLPPSASVIQQMIDGMEIFGMTGKRQPLFGSEVDQVLAKRFVVENGIFSPPTSRYDEDCKFASAIWYLIYSQIAASPESYDAAMPVVPLSPQDGVIASAVLSMVGSITQTAYAAATAPLYIDVLFSIRQLEETIEFIQTGPAYSTVDMDKVKTQLKHAKDKVSEAAYAPVVSFANTVYDYLKKLTGARYLLPEFLASYGAISGQKPFSPLPMPSDVVVPSKFRGYLKDAQRVVEFGGLDIPRMVEELKKRAADIDAQLMQYAHIYDGIYSGLALPRGAVFAHLDTLGTATDDPSLGSLEFPTPTDVYIVPSYIPKYQTLSNGQPLWVFDDLMYESIFPNGFQAAKLKSNLTMQYFSWDTVVKIPASPTTGSDFACLMIPSVYTADCFSRSMANDIASVSQFLGASPHRPMAEIADFFTPLFQSLGGGLNKAEVIANAVSSMFFLYRRTGKGSSKYQDQSAWDLITPQVPFIYGHPTRDLISANSPFDDADPRFKCEERHVKFSSDGQFMAVLHRALPKPSTLSYVPFTLSGGIKISLPVAQTVFRAAAEKANKAGAKNELAYYSSFMTALSKESVSNNLLPVTSWSPSYAFFPHLFASNRHVTGVSKVLLSEADKITARFVLVSDSHSPFGGVLAYHNTPVIGFDISDMTDALTSSDLIIDVNESVSKRSHAVVDKNKKEEIPDVKLNEEAPLNKKEEVDGKSNTSTNPKTGETVVDELPPLPDAATQLVQNADGTVDVNPVD